MQPPIKAPQSTLIADVTLETFMALVIQASHEKLVLVDFWAPWCGPCKQLTPLLEKLVTAQKGAVHLAKVDIEKCPEIAQQMRIQSVPAVFAFFKGQPVDGFMGALPEAQIKSWIEKLVQATNSANTTPEGATIKAMLEEADTALKTKNYETAEILYADIMDREPDNAEAYAGVIRCMIAQGHPQSARKMLDMAGPEIAKNKIMNSVRAELDLAEQAQNAPSETSTLEKKLQDNPNDHQTRFDLALAHFAANDRQAAVDDLLEIIRRDRTWNDEAARKQLLKFFEAFGLMDPLSVETRKRLSSMLFS